jgi:hypothetical protein
VKEGKGNKYREGEYFYPTIRLGEDNAEDSRKSLKHLLLCAPNRKCHGRGLKAVGFNARDMPDRIRGEITSEVSSCTRFQLRCGDSLSE